MKLLSVESSAISASCCVTENGRVLSHASVNAGLTHSCTLMPMILNTLKNADLSINDMDAIAVAAGPGSFTGVRIGVAAVKGLAFPKDLPCLSVSTLEGIAHLANGIPFNGLICPLMDARCKQVYTALFSSENGVLTRIQDDTAISCDDVKNRLLSENKPVYLVGDGAAMCFEEWKDDIPNLFLAPDSIRFPNATGIAIVAEKKWNNQETVSAADLQPVYLRLPQAERELKAKQAAHE